MALVRVCVGPVCPAIRLTAVHLSAMAYVHQKRTQTADRTIGRGHCGKLFEYDGESGHATLETNAAREHATA